MVVLQMLSLLSVAIHWHLLETISLTITGNLVTSSHSSVKRLQLWKLVKAVRSEDQIVIKQIKHGVVNERNLKLHFAEF